MKFKNIYFIIGNAYAGKSTMINLLAKKYNGILCEENYHNKVLNELDANDFPALTYTRDLKDWREFIRRTPKQYEMWIKDVSKECEIIELQLLKKIVNENKKVFVDTNISIETLKKISDKDHVLVMLTDPKISVNRFFERSDKEKQFLYKLLLQEENPNEALDNFRKCLERINTEENYQMYFNSGFNVIIRDDDRSIDETLKLVEEKFKLIN